MQIEADEFQEENWILSSNDKTMNEFTYDISPVLY